MPFQPGPFHQLASVDVNLTPGVYTYTADATDLAAQLGSVTAGWSAAIADLTNLSLEPADISIGIDIDGIIRDIGYQAAGLVTPDLDIIDQGWASGSTQLNAATAFAPPQAWADPGEPYTPPGSVLTLAVPTVNPNAFVPAQNFTVGATTEGLSPAVGLYNTTRVGAQNFTVGDNFTLIALGDPGQEVTVNAIFNGVQLPAADFGTIDSTKQLFITGTMPPENAGVWREDWSIAGQLVASFNFVVSGS